MVSSILLKNERWDNFQYIKLFQRSFFGGIEDTINCFRDLLTFTVQTRQSVLMSISARCTILTYILLNLHCTEISQLGACLDSLVYINSSVHFTALPNRYATRRCKSAMYLLNFRNNCLAKNFSGFGCSTFLNPIRKQVHVT